MGSVLKNKLPPFDAHLPHSSPLEVDAQTITGGHVDGCGIVVLPISCKV